MKFSKLSQLILVSSIGLLVATVFTGCAITTIDYVFVASSAGSGTSSNGQIETYAVDSQSGALRTGASTVSSGGVNPISMAVTPDYENLYVANAGSSTVVHFTLGLHGELTSKDTITTSGTPVALAVNAANTYLYVLSGPSPAVLTAYALSGGTIGSAGSPQTLKLYGNYAAYSGDVIVPTGLTVLANSAAVYVTAYDQSAYNPGCTPAPACTPSTANPGWVFGFTAGSGGVLTEAANPYQAGIKPVGIAADPTNRYAYVTDYASNQLIGYAIMGGNTLNPLSNGPFRTGNEPSAVIIDQRGKFIYVTNSLDSSVSSYAIDLATGTPTGAVGISGAGSNATDTEPVAIAIDAALGRFVYTANYLGNSVSGFRLDPTSGALTPTQATPYPTGAKPAAVISVPHGNYSTQSVNP
jgi:6-phosphogluconolactonase (cycloisomerase 2 family)